MSEIEIMLKEVTREVVFKTTLDASSFEYVAEAFYYAALAMGFHPDTVKEYINRE